jgi:hypothetical protein
MLKRIIIAIINALILFFFSGFLISFIIETARTMGSELPDMNPHDHFDINNVYLNYFNYTFYSLIISSCHFLSELILKKSIFSNYWRSSSDNIKLDDN